MACQCRVSLVLPTAWGPLLLGVIATGGCVATRQPMTDSLVARPQAPWRANLTAPSLSEGQAKVLSWWRGLNDPVFAELAEKALQANLDLAFARERIVEARARRGVVNADHLPQVDFNADYSRAGSGDDALSFAAPPPGHETDLFAAGVIAGWEIDLWGRVQRLVDAADADAQAAIEDYRDAAVSLLSELALAYIDVRTLERRLVLVEQNATLQQRTLELAESRFAAGNGPELDVALARRLLKRTQARIPELRRAKSVAENRIAVLLGRRPADDLVSPGELPVVLIPVDMGLPADLITRRADIRRAAWIYRAALARTDATAAERLPRLTLSGSFRLSGSDAGTLFADALVYSLGPQVSFPLFDASRIDANVRVRESQSEQARLVLEQSLLQAVEEVENAAVGYSRKKEQVGELEEAAESAERSVALAGQLYRAGLSDLGQSLDAQRELVIVEDELAVTNQQLLAEAIRLYRALGGGWEVMRLDGSTVAER